MKLDLKPYSVPENIGDTSFTWSNSIREPISKQINGITDPIESELKEKFKEKFGQNGLDNIDFLKNNIEGFDALLKDFKAVDTFSKSGSDFFFKIETGILEKIFELSGNNNFFQIIKIIAGLAPNEYNGEKIINHFSNKVNDILSSNIFTSSNTIPNKIIFTDELASEQERAFNFLKTSYNIIGKKIFKRLDLLKSIFKANSLKINETSKEINDFLKTYGTLNGDEYLKFLEFLFLTEDVSVAKMSVAEISNRESEKKKKFSIDLYEKYKITENIFNQGEINNLDKKEFSIQQGFLNKLNPKNKRLYEFGIENFGDEIKSIEDLVLFNDFGKKINKDIYKIEYCVKNVGFDLDLLIKYNKENKKIVFRENVLDVISDIYSLNKKGDKISQLLKNQENFFNTNNISMLDRANFYDKLLDYSDEMIILIFDITSKLDKNKFNYVKDKLFSLIHTNYILLNNGKVNNENIDFNEIILNIKNIDFNNKNEFKEKVDNNSSKLEELLKNNFKDILGIKKNPEKFSEKNIVTLVNHLTYLANINEGYYINDTEKQEAILIFFMALKLNNLWDKFQNGEDIDIDIDIDELLDEDKAIIIKEYVQDRENKNNVKKDFSKKDFEILNKEEYSQFNGNIEEIDSFLINIDSNITNLLDTDVYSDDEKLILGFIGKYTNKIGAGLANKFQKLSGKAEIKDEFLDMLDVGLFNTKSENT